MGFAFAGIVINPNMTRRGSIYMRKFNPVLLGACGFAWGRKKESDATFAILMKQHDYMPLEVKRTLATKDYRHMALFNYKNPDRQLFCEKTGKALS